MGAKTTNVVGPKLDSIQIQQSAKNVTITQCWGTVRANCNMLWVGDFTAISHTEQQGGKGAGKYRNTTYTYTASLILGICKGEIEGVRTIYRDKSVFTDGATTALAQAGLSLATGAIGQAVWGHLTTNHPDEALGYSGIAYAYADNYDLGDSGGFGNHGFEVVTQVRQEVGAGFLDDANPADILDDFFNNPNDGLPFWRAGLLGDLSDYLSYCLASGLLLSPLLDSQTQASAFVEDLLAASNSDCLWSDGVLKVRPLGDAEVTGNGETWTPDLTPLYDLTVDDFLLDGDDDPVRQEIKRPAEAYNVVQVAYLDRASQYAEDVISAMDQANIEAFGQRKADPKSLHAICDKDVARLVAQLRLQRSCYVRRKFTFSLDWRYCLLEPLDLVTLTISTAQLTLDRQLVRILKIAENDDGESFDIEAEEMLVGTAAAPAYGAQAGTGYTPNYDVSPGDIETPYIFTPPSVLTPNGRETWAAVAGLDPNWGGADVWTSLDDVNYTLVGRILGPARYGEITNILPVTSDPDTTSILGVDLTISGAELGDATEADADADVTLFLLGEELLAYGAADLDDPNIYLLSYLRRGQLGTAQGSYAIGDPWVRLDEGVFRIPFLTSQADQTVYVKFSSINVYGRAPRPLEDCTAYEITPTTVIAKAPSAPAWTLTGTTFVEGDDAIPAIVVEGACDNADATGMQLYIRVTGLTPWAASGGIVARGATKMEITGVTAGTTYDVGITYIVGGVEGDILNIGSATAGVEKSSPGGGPADGTELFSRDASGDYSFTVPPGVDFVDVEGWGPGGYGYGSTNVGTEKEPSYVPNAGGGAGGYFKKHIAVTSGDIIPGAVGVAGTSNTTVTTIFSATANRGGSATDASTPGTGGTATGGDTNTTGHAGGLTNLWDGGGAGPALVDQTTPDSPGTVPGGGAPGGFGSSPATGRIRITARTS